MSRNTRANIRASIRTITGDEPGRLSRTRARVETALHAAAFVSPLTELRHNLVTHWFFVWRDSPLHRVAAVRSACSSLSTLAGSRCYSQEGKRLGTSVSTPGCFPSRTTCLRRIWNAWRSSVATTRTTKVKSKSWRKIRDERAKSSPERLAEIDRAARAESARITMTLEELRRARRQTQAQLADQLGTNQGALSRLERQADLYVSTLRRFVEAVGGELEIVVRFADGSAVEVDLFSE
jgi:hypothetical protein